MTITTVFCCGWKLYKLAGEMEDEEAEDADDTGPNKSGVPEPQTMGTTDLEIGTLPRVAEGELPQPEGGMPQPRGDKDVEGASIAEAAHSDNATSEPTLQPRASRSMSQGTPDEHAGCRMAPPWLNGWIAGWLGASDDKKTASSDAVTSSSTTTDKV